MSGWSKTLGAAMQMQGTVGAALVDLETGACMAVAEHGEEDSLSLSAVVNARMLRAQMRLAQGQRSSASVDDLLITFGHQYHLIRPVRNGLGIPSMFLYLVMDRIQANLAMTRRKIIELEEWISQTVEIDLQINAARKVPAVEGRGATKEALPAFMREETVMRLLGVPSERAAANRPIVPMG